MKTLINVCGTARSGSTLVDLMLGNDPRAFSLGEAASWYHPWRTHHFDIKCGCGVYPCPVWKELRELPAAELYEQIFVRQDVDIICDSSKHLFWVMDSYRRESAKPDRRVLNLFLYKEPIALYYSHWKRGERSPETIAGRYRYYEQALQTGLPFVTVSYDWLIADIANSLPLLCSVLDIPYFAGKEEFWNKRHHQLFGSFGPRKQALSGVGSIYHEEFPAEYRTEIPELEKRFAADERLRSIVAELEARDVRHVQSYPEDSPAKLRRPLFYYRQKLRFLRLRFFPEPYADKEASVIREWHV